MFYKKYYWRHSSGKEGSSDFDRAHYHKAGFSRPELFTLGMPELEALRLVNEWNHNEHGWRYWV